MTPTLREPRAVGDLVDWGAVPDMIEGQSTTSGVILHKGAEGESECGIWVCTPGTWHCHVTSDEFCHFLEGRCTYTRETGPGEPDEVIERKQFLGVRHAVEVSEAPMAPGKL